jgi:aflatoxin B1 aldehyde reductase
MNFVLGTMNIDYPYSSNIEKTYQSYKEIVDKYIYASEQPILDTAYYYGNTKTEEILGDILQDINTNKKITIATKANPWFENDFTNGVLGQLSTNNLERQLTTSLTNLKKEKVDVFYLHSPDHETPIRETLTACDSLWRRDKFDFLGISNYSVKQLREIIDLCEKEALVSPKYYQGMYNLISRKIEEIFPVLDDYGIEFWAYNPLAGGLLTGKYSNEMTSSRFKDNRIYQNIFWKHEIVISFAFLQ